MRSKCLWPIIDDPSDEGFHDTEFTVDSQNLRKKKNKKWISEELFYFKKRISTKFPWKNRRITSLLIFFIKTHDQHDEKNHCPDRSSRKFQDNFGVSDKNESGATFDHVGHIGRLFHSDVTENRKRNASREQARQRVDNARDESISGKNGKIFKKIFKKIKKYFFKVEKYLKNENFGFFPESRSCKFFNFIMAPKNRVSTHL